MTAESALESFCCNKRSNREGGPARNQRRCCNFRKPEHSNEDPVQLKKKKRIEEFPGGSGKEIFSFHCRRGLILDWGTKVLSFSRQKKKEEEEWSRVEGREVGRRKASLDWSQRQGLCGTKRKLSLEKEPGDRRKIIRGQVKLGQLGRHPRSFQTQGLECRRAGG